MSTKNENMRNEHNWDNSKNSKYKIFLMNNQDIMFGLSLPYEKSRKIENDK